MSSFDDDVLASAAASGDGSETLEPSPLGTAITVGIFLGASGFVLYRIVKSRAPPSAAELEAKEKAAKDARAQVATAAKSHRRDRTTMLRSSQEKICLHQFQYAWGVQAHLRMANADFDEHNVRAIEAAAGLELPVVLCGQHVVAAPSIPRVLAEAFPLAAAGGTGGHDEAARQRRLSLLSLQVAELQRLLRCKLWHAGSPLRNALGSRLMAGTTAAHGLYYYFSLVARMQKAYAPRGAEVGSRVDVDFAGGEAEVVARLRQARCAACCRGRRRRRCAVPASLSSSSSSSPLCVCLSLSFTELSSTNLIAHKHTRTHARAHPHPPTRAHPPKHTHTQTRARACACTAHAPRASRC
jgi:hypothetical protein